MWKSGILLRMMSKNTLIPDYTHQCLQTKILPLAGCYSALTVQVLKQKHPKAALQAAKARGTELQTQGHNITDSGDVWECICEWKVTWKKKPRWKRVEWKNRGWRGGNWARSDWWLKKTEEGWRWGRRWGKVEGKLHSLLMTQQP